MDVPVLPPPYVSSHVSHEYIIPRYGPGLAGKNFLTMIFMCEKKHVENNVFIIKYIFFVRRTRNILLFLQFCPRFVLIQVMMFARRLLQMHMIRYDGASDTD